MSKTRALIVDDELKSREVIKTLLGAFCPEVEVVADAEDIAGALRAIEDYKPQLVFLDITLKEGDSFQILKEIDEIDFEIIFVTAYDEYSIKALKFSGIKCLFKPLDIEELQAAVKDAISHKTNTTAAYQMVNGILTSKFTKIPVITSAGLVFTPVKDITYIESSDIGSSIHFIDGHSVDSKRDISEFDDILIGDSFRFVDKLYLINLDQVSLGYSKDKTVGFTNGTSVAIKSKVKDLL